MHFIDFNVEIFLKQYMCVPPGVRDHLRRFLDEKTMEKAGGG